MQVYVRVNGSISRSLGRSRLTVELAQDATVADLIARLRTLHPEIAGALNYAVPVLSGVHCTAATPLAEAQEVALLTPIAGGSL